MITLEQLQQIFPQTKNPVLEAYIGSLNKYMEEGEINTKMRVAAFIAQVGHESGGLAITQENLNYSIDGLLKIFPKYFTSREQAAQYARQPEKIANRVYASRMGNGPESSGEGWKFRGRGLIQLTGKENYTKFAEHCKLSLEETITFLQTPAGACSSAVWFWTARNLNRYADEADMLRITKIINGGENGLDHRMALYSIAMSVL